MRQSTLLVVTSQTEVAVLIRHAEKVCNSCRIVYIVAGRALHLATRAEKIRDRSSLKEIRVTTAYAARVYKRYRMIITYIFADIC